MGRNWLMWGLLIVVLLIGVLFYGGKEKWLVQKEKVASTQEGVPPNKPPEIFIDISPKGGEAPLAVVFTGGGEDSDGNVVRYEWDFTDDGTYDWVSTEGGNTSYIYVNPGTYTAKFRVTDDDGKMKVTSVVIPVLPALAGPKTKQVTETAHRPEALAEIPLDRMFNAPPTAKAGPDITVARGDKIVLDGSGSSDPDGKVVSYHWTAKEKLNIKTNKPVLTLTPNSKLAGQSGKHMVTLTVTDNNGNKGSDTATVTVLKSEVKSKVRSHKVMSEVKREGNLAPAVQATANSTKGKSPFTVFFAAQGNDPDGQVISYEWDFDEGGYDWKGSKGEAVYTYTKAGVYLAQVKVTDNQRASATDTIIIVVLSGEEIK
ncbi:MAG: PKD domain-containing protein [bacterium]